MATRLVVGMDDDLNILMKVFVEDGPACVVPLTEDDAFLVASTLMHTVQSRQMLIEGELRDITG